MKKFGLTAIFLLICAFTSQGQSCDCTITPFKPNPPCFNNCAVNLLATTNLNELILVLGVKEESAARIVNWAKRRIVKSLADYGQVLNAVELQDLTRRVNSLNRQQLIYINRDRSLSQPATLLQLGTPSSVSGTSDSTTTIAGGSASGARVYDEASTATGASAETASKNSKLGEGQTVSAMATPGAAEKGATSPVYQYYKDRKGKWRWQLRASDGRILANSFGGYENKADCLSAINRVKSSADAPIVKK